MANSYTQIYLQFVFAVKYRNAIINESWETDLYKYITGIVQNNKHKLISINGMPDHIHILVGFHTTQSIADLLRDIKANSSKWINENNFTKEKFEWQTGYGAFSYSKSHLQNVINYINNQKQHHQKQTFLEEYKEFLNKFEIEYNIEFSFKELI
ncbi:MAG TPA: IS200/IS605 family transposase [Chitinophagales bacterium]|nr:IS200/IS605 family transposase [Chitinophagales bacterium]